MPKYFLVPVYYASFISFVLFPVALWWVSAQYYIYYVQHFATLFNTVEAFGLIFHNHSPNYCAGRHKPLLSCCTDCGGRQGEFSRPAEFELSDWIRDCSVRCVPQRSEWRSQRQPDHTWVILKTCHNQHWLQNISKHMCYRLVSFTISLSNSITHKPHAYIFPKYPLLCISISTFLYTVYFLTTTL